MHMLYHTDKLIKGLMFRFGDHCRSDTTYSREQQMTTLTYDERIDSKHDELQITDQIKHRVDTSFKDFNAIIKFYSLFNIVFLMLALTELATLFFFLSYPSKTLFSAIALATLCMTFFSYFVLRIYLQARKMEQFEELSQKYVHACCEIIDYQQGILDHHVTLANACCKFASHLQGKEYSYLPLLRRVKFVQPIIEKFSCWWHWQDFQRMQELLLTASIEEHIKMVKCEPTSLEIHAALANAYVMLSCLYVDPRKIDENYTADRWIPPQKFSKVHEDKFKYIANKAIEEFKVLSEFAPNDPWVHVQLAYSYRDLGMPLEEIKQYETVLSIIPNDPETIFKLGKLYFEQGYNADGLRLYEKLKQFSYKKAEALIKFYGMAEPSVK